MSQNINILTDNVLKYGPYKVGLRQKCCYKLGGCDTKGNTNLKEFFDFDLIKVPFRIDTIFALKIILKPYILKLQSVF